MNATAARSTFVTVLAWISIAFTGFGTLISILQNIMIHTMFVGPEFDRAMRAAPPEGVPAPAAFMMSHMQLLFGAFLAVSALTLVVSIGLLLRKNWARLAYIGLMALGIVWSVVGLGFQFWMFSSMQELFQQASQGAPNMKPFFIAMSVISVLFAAGFAWLYGWIIKRLLSAPIAAEFKGA